jgi:hypothetical protein
MMKQTIFLILVFACPTLFAQGLFESSTAENKQQANEPSIDFSGYARGSAYGGLGNYDYTSVFGEFSLQGKFKHNKALLFTDIRIRSGYQFDNAFTHLQLKELYAGYSGHKLDVFLGNQIVSWGRTDGFNPTNCITPTDYFFLSGDPDDQNLPNFMLRLKYRINAKIDLELTGIPVYKPSVYLYRLFDFGENVHFTEPVLPAKVFENSTLAARINFEVSKLGFSFSYFRGYNPDYGFSIQNIDWESGMPEITNASSPYFKNMIGADLAIPLGSWIVRGEAAYNITTNYKNKMYIPNPDLHYVAGVERNIKGFNTILQYIGKYTFDFNELTEPVLNDPTDPMGQQQYANALIIYESSLLNRKIFFQQEKTNHALALTISKPFAYETWNAEITAYYNFTSKEYFFRPKLSWKISDALTASAGCSFMAGSEKELFDYAGPVLNGAFIELKVSF